MARRKKKKSKAARSRAARKAARTRKRHAAARRRAAKKAARKRKRGHRRKSLGASRARIRERLGLPPLTLARPRNEPRNGMRAVAAALKLARKPRPPRQTLSYGIPRI